MLDEELWADMVDPILVEFVQHAQTTAQKLYEESVNRSPNDPVNFEEFMDQEKYKPFAKGVKAERHAVVTESKRHHAFPIKFQ